MNGDWISTLWQKSKEKEPRMSAQEIDGILRRSTTSGWTELRRMVWFYLSIMAAILVMSGMNLAEYRANPAWVIALVGLITLSLGFLAFGAHLISDMRRLENPAEELITLVRRQLCFLRTTYQLWLGVVAVAIWLLGFTISLYLYAEDGRYAIHKDLFLAVFAVGQWLAIYAIVRIAHHPMMRRIQVVLEDLEAQAVEATSAFDKGRTYRIFVSILAVLIGLALLVGILVHLFGG